MQVNFEVANALKLFLPQTSGLTCWAACAAGVKSAQGKTLVHEQDILTGKYLQAFTQANPNDPDCPGRDLSATELIDLYSAQLKFNTKNMDVSSRDAVAKFVMTSAPIILMSSIVTFSSSGVQHQGYHVRLVYGVSGSTDSANEDDLLVKVFDPFPPTGWANYTSFYFSQFKYQVNLKTGPYASMVGQCWYA